MLKVVNNGIGTVYTYS